MHIKYSNNIILTISPIGIDEHESITNYMVDKVIVDKAVTLFSVFLK